MFFLRRRICKTKKNTCVHFCRQNFTGVLNGPARGSPGGPTYPPGPPSYSEKNGPWDRPRGPTIASSFPVTEDAQLSTSRILPVMDDKGMGSIVMCERGSLNKLSRRVVGLYKGYH